MIATRIGNCLGVVILGAGVMSTPGALAASAEMRVGLRIVASQGRPAQRAATAAATVPAARDEVRAPAVTTIIIGMR